MAILYFFTVHDFAVLFAVVQTRIRGGRLTREEISAAAPLIGRLTIEDWRGPNGSGRALRVANLHHATRAHHPTLLLPLFDPVLVRMTDCGFLLVGFQIEVVMGERIAEHVQGWWVKPAPPRPEIELVTEGS